MSADANPTSKPEIWRELADQEQDHLTLAVALDEACDEIERLQAIASAARDLVGTIRHPRIAVSEVAPGTSERLRRALESGV